jgi:iron(III) transport system permease protein
MSSTTALKPAGIPALLLVGVTLLPLVTVVALAFGWNAGRVTTEAGSWAHLLDTGLAAYVVNSVLLVLLVAVGVTLVGVGSAWLTVMCEFPGRSTVAWLLALPLALPAYVIAYAYTDFLQFSGPLQSGLRTLIGIDGLEWKARGYWFPEVRSLPGAALMFVLVLYPYVYLPVRAAFASGGASQFEAARTLGLSGGRAFIRVMLPLARPAIAGGVLLAMMETLADFGAVSYFGVETFTTGIYKAWFGLGDKATAARLACLLLGFTLLLLWLERRQRGRARYGSAGARTSGAAFRWSGWKTAAGIALGVAPVLLGFVLPLLILLRLGLRESESVDWTRFAGYAWNSVLVAGLAAAVALGAALVIAYAVRLDRRLTWTARAAALGYAVPGAVIAVGVLVPLALFDNVLAAFMREQFGVRTGLLLTGSVAALVFAYVVRFLAVAFNNVEAGLTRVTPSMDDAARSAGLSARATLLRVHVPIIAKSLAVAALLVFVDAMKELPATLAVRPFNFDTLATSAYTFAKDERLGEAAWPSLAIVLVSVIPVLMLSKVLAARRQS